MTIMCPFAPLGLVVEGGVPGLLLLVPGVTPGVTERTESPVYFCERCGAKLHVMSIGAVRTKPGRRPDRFRIHLACTDCAHEVEVTQAREALQGFGPSRSATLGGLVADVVVRTWGPTRS